MIYYPSLTLLVVSYTSASSKWLDTFSEPAKSTKFNILSVTIAPFYEFSASNYSIVGNLCYDYSLRYWRMKLFVIDWTYNLNIACERELLWFIAVYA